MFISCFESRLTLTVVMSSPAIYGTSLKLVDKFTYLGSSVSLTEKDIDTRLTKEWRAIDRLSIIWKSDLTDKMKRSFFQAAVVSILLYGCITWTLTKQLEKKLDGNYTRMLRVILNKSWQQHPTRHQLYGQLPPITKTIQVRRTRHAGHCWRSKDELISYVLLWTPAYGRAKAGRPARTYIQQLCEDMVCNPEDLPEAMNDREEWRERVRISVLVARHDNDDDCRHLTNFFVLNRIRQKRKFISKVQTIHRSSSLRQVAIPRLYYYP